MYPPESDLGAPLAALWSFPALAGPVASRSPDPWDQQPLEPAAHHRELCGVVSLPGGGQSACATYAYTHEQAAELEFAIPLGSLSLAWPEVGSFPFGVTLDGVEAWEPRLESLLLALAEHVHERAPFRRALTGFEGVGRALTPELEGPGPIPQTRGAGVIDPQEDGLAWYPPTMRGGFTFDER